MNTHSYTYTYTHTHTHAHTHIHTNSYHKQDFHNNIDSIKSLNVLIKKHGSYVYAIFSINFFFLKKKSFFYMFQYFFNLMILRVKLFKRGFLTSKILKSGVVKVTKRPSYLSIKIA